MAGLNVTKVSYGRCGYRAAFSLDAKGDRGDRIFDDGKKLDPMAAIDSLRIELEVLKTYMERFHPGFAESYPKFRQEAIQAIDPEWMTSVSAKRIEGS